MKLTQPQLDILRAMADGWELSAFEGSYMMRKHGAGRWKDVPANTVRWLRDRGLVKARPYKSGQHGSSFALTPDGVKALHAGDDGVPRNRKPKALKVYGWMGLRSECKPAANGSQQTREIVAAYSKAEVFRLFANRWDRPRGEEMGETGNVVEISVAMSKPGVVFWCPLDTNNKPDAFRPDVELAKAMEKVL